MRFELAGKSNVVKALNWGDGLPALRRAANWFRQERPARRAPRITKRRSLMLTNNDILAALAAVPGPDGKTPLPQSGAIDGLTIRDGKVFLAVKINPAHARAMEALRGEAEAKIKALPGVVSALVTLTAESQRPSRQAAAGRRRPQPQSRAAARSARNPRRRQNHRRRLGQGRRRQVDDRLQSCAWPRAAWLACRRARRRRVRAVDAAPLWHHP